MIIDKDVKIAESPEEAFWTTFKERCLKDIETHKREIIINEHLLKLANEKLAKR
jgi:hypothetical protein